MKAFHKTIAVIFILAVLGLAAYHGVQSGCCYAEAFELAFLRY